MRKKKFRITFLLLLLCGLCIPGMTAAADTVYDSPYVSFSPDGEGFTIQAGDVDYNFYEEGTTISTGLTSSVRDLEAGEHYYYKWKRTENVPIGKWVVEHKYAQCIHDVHRTSDDYLGLEFGRSNCFGYYNSGWVPYCADCGELIQYTYFYMNAAAAHSIDYLPCGMGLDYYHLCPHCNNLEQGVLLSNHMCKAISWNKYRIRYDNNRSSLPWDSNGYMNPSFHMYNNATMYEGEPVVASRKLTGNAYSCPGYEFAGWNTEPDGSGTFFADKADIWNLTAYDINADGEELATITLYAQWTRSESTLRIDPAGGRYDGNGGITSITQDYGTGYTVEDSKLTAPAGYRVTFEENGGTAVNDVTGTRHFTEWSMVQPFRGRFVNNVYFFMSPSGTTDTIRAIYTPDSIVLPETTKANASFGGWYYDAEFTRPAGAPGDRITPTRNLTLYAQWVELRLRSEDNYMGNSQKGAVDLTWGWTTPIASRQAYRLYQSRDNQNWNQVNSAADVGGLLSVSESFSYSGYTKTYTVPYSGLYTLTAYGAQGGSYGVQSGGRGGCVSGTFWLSMGDVLTYRIGGQNGYGGGGSMSAGGFSKGGGYTMISSQNLGATLLIAGGGGGATSMQDGGAGGSEAGVAGSGNVQGSTGTGGMAGGGGGYQGGSAGTYIPGETVTTYVKIEGETLAFPYRSFARDSQSHKLAAAEDERVQIVDENGNTVTAVKLLLTDGTYVYGTGLGDEDFAVRDSGVHQDMIRVTDSACYLYYGDCGRHSTPRTGYHTLYNNLCNGKKDFYRKTETPTQGVVTPAYGGSNYVNTSLCVNFTSRAGVQTGNGALSIQSQSVGFLETLSLDAVAAPDQAAPKAVRKESIKPVSNSNGSMVKVSWTEAEDVGTTYYHMVESHLAHTGAKLCTSNRVSNTLTTGVLGYYYILNTNADTTVNAGNGTFVGKEKTWVHVALTDETQYLHVAPVDVAGNVGRTCHIVILSGSSAPLPWPIYTEQLSIEEAEHVYYEAGEGVYYVRCDDATPFALDFNSYIAGNATPGYQINRTIYESRMDGFDTAWNIVETPMHGIGEGSIETNAAGLSFETSGVPVLKQYMNAKTVRSNANSRIWVTSEFLLGEQAHGKHIRVTPRAAVVSDTYNGFSEQAQDLTNSITLVGDCEAPEITGTEILNQLYLIDRSKETVNLELGAWDDLSGVREFTMDIFNTDNAISKAYTAGADGRIMLDITALEPVFSGDFTVTLRAVDNVGNVHTEVYDITEFALETRVERILSPHEPVFKCGESGILTIQTWGYVGKLTIEFPEELVALEPSLNQTITYEIPTYTQTEEIQFMVPLYTPYQDDYVITVRAYKGEKHLEDYPEMDVIGIGGTVLDEIRTRLR